MLTSFPIAELRRAYNSGKAIGQTRFAPHMGITYRGQLIDIDFQRNLIVDYISQETGQVISRFQDVAYLDD